MDCRAVFSADCKLSPQLYLAPIHMRAYVQWNDARVGRHAAGSRSPLDWFELSVTATNCAVPNEFAKSSRRAVDHPLAPDRHASANGTT